MERQLPNGWTRESLRKMIIQRSKQTGYPPLNDIFHWLSALERMTDKQLAEVIRKLTER